MSIERPHLNLNDGHYSPEPRLKNALFFFFFTFYNAQ